MRYTRSAAIKLNDDIIESCRVIVNEYAIIFSSLDEMSRNWKDNKYLEFKNSIFEMNATMTETLEEVKRYTDYLKHKIEEYR